MPEEIPVGDFNFQYKGVYDLDAFYADMAQFFNDRKYILNEDIYKHKIPEIQLNWSAYRDDSEFKRSYLKVNLWSFNTKEVRVKIGGKEKVMYDGRVRMFITSKLIYDQKKRYEKNELLKLMRKFLMRVIFFYKILGDWDDLFYETNDLKNIIKAAVNSSAQGGGWND